MDNTSNDKTLSLLEKEFPLCEVYRSTRLDGYIVVLWEPRINPIVMYLDKVWSLLRKSLFGRYIDGIVGDIVWKIDFSLKQYYSNKGPLHKFYISRDGLVNDIFPLEKTTLKKQKIIIKKHILWHLPKFLYRMYQLKRLKEINNIFTFFAKCEEK